MPSTCKISTFITCGHSLELNLEILDLLILDVELVRGLVEDLMGTLKLFISIYVQGAEFISLKAKAITSTEDWRRMRLSRSIMIKRGVWALFAVLQQNLYLDRKVISGTFVIIHWLRILLTSLK